jgi:hypothetical protein
LVIQDVVLGTVRPTKTTKTAAYAAVLDRTSINPSRSKAMVNPKIDTHTVVATRLV